MMGMRGGMGMGGGMYGGGGMMGMSGGMGMRGGMGMQGMMGNSTQNAQLYGPDTTSLEKVGNALSTNSKILDAVARVLVLKPLRWALDRGEKGQGLEIKLYMLLKGLGTLRTWLANGGRLNEDEEDKNPHTLIRNLRWSNRQKEEEEERREAAWQARRKLLLKQIYGWAMVLVCMLVKIVQARQKPNKVQAWHEIRLLQPRL